MHVKECIRNQPRRLDREKNPIVVSRRAQIVKSSCDILRILVKDGVATVSIHKDDHEQQPM